MHRDSRVGLYRPCYDIYHWHSGKLSLAIPSWLSAMNTMVTAIAVEETMSRAPVT